MFSGEIGGTGTEEIGNLLRQEEAGHNPFGDGGTGSTLCFPDSVTELRDISGSNNETLRIRFQVAGYDGF